MTAATASGSRLVVARAQIAGHAATLRALEARVEALHCAGDREGAAAIAQVAGEFAYRNHAGVFASPRIERVLAAIGREAVGAGPRPDPAPGTVLHVLTEGYDTGGHTRLAWRWMQRDAGRRSTVALTRQTTPLPDRLAGAADGRVLRLDAEGGLLARARALRAAAARFETVVLHVHMYDVVAALAFAEPAGRPPVVFVDHADHLFWLGTGVADAVTACRAPATDLHVRRRGIAAERSVLVPVPVDAPRRARDRAAAKAAVGVAPGAPLLLTIATAHKFVSAVRPGFHEAAVGILEACPDAVLLAVGPSQVGDWAAAAERFPGRVRAVGRLDDLGDVLDAADVYLDSFPFSSNTSVIEAAAHELPILSFSPDPGRQGILLTNDPGIEHLIVRGADPASLGERAAELLADDAHSAALGAEVRDGILAVHDGPGWTARVEEAYRVARDLGPAPAAADVGDLPVEDFEAIHHLLFEDTGVTCGLDVALLTQADVLPAHLRPADRLQAAAAARELVRPPAAERVAVGRFAPGAAAALVAALRGAVREGAAARAAVVVAPAEVGGALPELEAALASGEDFDLDVVPAGAIAEVAGADGVWVVAEGSPDARAAAERGAALLTY